MSRNPLITSVTPSEFAKLCGPDDPPAEGEISDDEVEDLFGPIRETGPLVQVFDKKEVNLLKITANLSDSDAKMRLRGLHDRLMLANNVKELAIVPPDWHSKLDTLLTVHPNFEEFISFLRGQFALSSLGDKRVSLPPVLFSGPPGVGKTEIVLTLAAMVETDFLHVDMASAQSGSSLTGSEAFWSNSKEGRLFSSLTASNTTANPIVYLDELDKIRGDERFRPDAGLYQLLEPATARKFKDLSLPDISVDASHVIWFAAANSMDAIETPILSRFVCFEISAPDREQSKQIANTIYGRLRESNTWGQQFPATLSDDVADLLANLSPREMRINLLKALGTAACHERISLIASDFSLPKQKASIGF